MRSRVFGAVLLGISSACAENAAPREPPPPTRSESPMAPATGTEPAHAPRQAPDGDYFELGDLVGRKLDDLHPATCASADGWELDSGIFVAERALAVRRCARFRGPHDVGDGAGGGSMLSVVSDGGTVVFAVATREYELEPAQRTVEKLLRVLTRSGCRQVYSDDGTVGFVDCPGRASWAAVTRLVVPTDAGTRHAVVLEVANDRGTAASIAQAYAERIRNSR